MLVENLVQGAENPEFDMDSPDVCVLEDRNNRSNPEGSIVRVEGNPAQSTSSSKGSVKSRLKALILEEKHKRKGHHRTATHPARTQLTRTDSIHRSEDAELGRLLDDPEIGALNPISSPSSDDSCGECNRMLAGRGVWYDHEKPHSGYEKLAQKESVPSKKQKHKAECAKRLAKSASAIQSRHMMDAMDIFAMNKEFLMKVLQDPESPLANHFQKNKDSASKIGLTKCGSFPLPGSSSRVCSRSRSTKQKGEKERDSPNSHETRHRGESTEDICKRSMPLIAAEHRADGIMQLNQAKEIADHTAQNPKKSYDNQAVIKRFKGIKQKIVHAIKEGKKETYRITMDAVLHKIPHKKGFSKDLTKEDLDQFKHPGPGRKETSPLAHSNSKTRPQHFRRTSSLNESMERYVHLFECSCHKELEHQHTPDKLKFRAEEGAVLAPRSTPCKESATTSYS